jgi:acyl dehydratase
VALNREYIGRIWRSAEVYEVSREKIRDYAMAIGERHPVYLDDRVARELGHPAVVAPPTFATVLWARMNTWPLREPDIGRSRQPNMVIGDEHITHHRTIHAGDRLVFATRVRDIRDLGGRHELLEMEHTITTTAGEPVCTIVDMAISRDTAVREEGAR